jgi:fumarate hydratase class II
MDKLMPEIISMHQEFINKAKAWHDVIKIGRTHLQDATPVTLGQEFSAFAAQIKYNITRIKAALHEVYYLAQGGTAVGTGLNSHAKFPAKFITYINKLTGLEFKTATNKFEALSSHDGLVNLSGALTTFAVSLMKMANDIRLLASGPRCGIGELHLPENEPGSSIMPGKVNPTQSEALTMICAQVMGNNTTISIAGASGHLQLNVFKPVIIYNLLQSIKILQQGIASFTKNCLIGIEPNYHRIQELRDKSLMLVTALNSKTGYDNAAKITKYALLHNMSLKNAAIALNFLTSEEFDNLVQIEKMLLPAE